MSKTVADITWEWLDKENKWLRAEVEKLKIEIWWLMWERDGLKMVVEKLHKEIEEQDKEYCKLKEERDKYFSEYHLRHS